LESILRVSAIVLEDIKVAPVTVVVRGSVVVDAVVGDLVAEVIERSVDVNGVDVVVVGGWWSCWVSGTLDVPSDTGLFACRLVRPRVAPWLPAYPLPAANH